jgi:peroxiredoxin
LDAADGIIRTYEGDPLELERAVVLYACAYGDVRAAGDRHFPESGTTPPDFELPRFVATGGAGPTTSGGSSVRLSDLKGKIVVLDFWATWCRPCRDELPAVDSAARHYRGSGVVVYTILHEDDPGEAAQYLTEHGFDLPMLLDPGRKAADAYQVRGIPSVWIIGRDGKVVQRGFGFAPEMLSKKLESLL